MIEFRSSFCSCVQIRHHDPGRLEWRGLAGGKREDFLGGLFLNDRLLALAFVQRFDERAREVLFFAEDAKSLAGAGFDLGGVGAHERRSADDALVSDDR